MSERQPKTIQVSVTVPIFDLIESGEKSIEVRVRDAYFANIAVGDKFRLISKNRIGYRNIIRIGTYSNFEDLVAREKSGNIYPGATPSEILAGLRRIYAFSAERKGVLAFELGEDLIKRR